MTHNLAINDNLYQLEQLLLAKISKLRQGISRNQSHIESEVQKLNELNAREERQFSEAFTEFRTKVRALIPLIEKATLENLLDRNIRDLLIIIREDIINQIDPFRLNDQPLDFAFKADTGAEDPAGAKPNTEYGYSGDDDDDNDEDKSVDPEISERAKRDFEEFMREMRESERVRRLKDPFSRESIDALKQGSEAQDIRKLYLHLSKQIHPDLAVNTDDAARRTTLMQRLSSAYHNGDFATLLAIQESLDIDCFTPTSADGSVTEERIASLRNTIEHLEEQAKILDRHKRRMARSQSGKLLKMTRALGEDAFEKKYSPLITTNKMLGEVIRLTELGLKGKIDLEELQFMLESVLGFGGENFDDWELSSEEEEEKNIGGWIYTPGKKHGDKKNKGDTGKRKRAKRG